MNYFWTEEETQFLLCNYSLHGIKYCSNKLNRSESSVHHKAAKLGLKAPGSKKKTSLSYSLELLEREINYNPIEEYINNRTPILHTCLEEHTWKVRPTDILNGTGCPICSGNKKRTHEEYLQLLKNRSIVPTESYINALTPINHFCSCGHEWKAAPHDILKGKSCPACASYGFQLDKPAILYYIKIGEYYKIGITNRTILERFSQDRDKEIKIIEEIRYNKGYDAEIAERQLLNIHQEHRLNIKNYLKSGGNTELFQFDVLNKEKPQST